MPGRRLHGHARRQDWHRGWQRQGEAPWQPLSERRACLRPSGSSLGAPREVCLVAPQSARCLPNGLPLQHMQFHLAAVLRRARVAPRSASSHLLEWMGQALEADRGRHVQCLGRVEVQWRGGIEAANYDLGRQRLGSNLAS